MTFFKRVLGFLPNPARQAVPLYGIFVGQWQPASAIAVYWLESVALAAIAVTLCVQLKKRTSDAEIGRAQAAGDSEFASLIQQEQRAARAAGVDPGSVLLFHGGSLAVFGLFIGAILFILTSKGTLEHPFDWDEFADGANAMLLAIAIGLAIEWLLFPQASVDAVQGRVNACNGRWALLWLVGFGGTAAMVFTGRPGTFIAFFAILKVAWEALSTLARVFNWRSLQDRAAG